MYSTLNLPGLTGVNTQLHNPTLRVLAILHLIDISPEGISLAGISEKLQLPKGTISPILKTLTATGFISCENSLYKMDFRSFELGLSYGGSEILDIINEQMRRIVAEVEEICQCAVLNGLDALYILRVNSNNPISIVSSVGKLVPAHITALGKVMLSRYDDDWLREAYKDYSFVRLTPKTITSIEDLLEDIHEIRRTGIGHDYEESMLGVNCTAVPLCFNGQIEGALSITTPLPRLDEHKKQLIEKELLEKKQLIEEICKIHGLTLRKH